jgi:hypothetical protein
MKSVILTKNFSNFSTPGPAVPGDFSREDWLSGRSATYLARRTHQMHQIPLPLGNLCFFWQVKMGLPSSSAKITTDHNIIRMMTIQIHSTAVNQSL